MSWQVGLYVAAVLIPLGAFAIELVGIRLLGRLNAYLATGAIALSCILSLVGFIDYFFVEARGVFAERHPTKQVVPEPGQVPPPEAGAESGHAASGRRQGPLVWKASYDWVTLGAGSYAPEGEASPAGLTIPLAVHVDHLTVLMFLMVSFIATVIHIYSMGYMHDDVRYPRFFTYLSLFCFSMLGLVASANVFMIFIFWELVGLCSYLLIGHWYEDKKNADAANKAFIVNRVGDVGMLVGLGLLWTSLGTFSIDEINRSLRDEHGYLNVEKTGEREGYARLVELRDRETGKVLVDEATGRPRRIALWVLGIAGLGVFAGCVGKSAQFPLHVWLPDAMAGPTPVSALIHAATMVAAGVYLVGRFYPVFTGKVLLYIAYTGGITLFIAASIAIVQTDYKKVLAYSTVSQLGYMMLGLGVGGWAAGLFHLLTHAFFKALLFLGAGSVYHSVHTYEMPVLGGLRRKMPITAYTMLAATLAISGVPFFSGFYSKDAILASALYRFWQSPEHVLLFLLPTVGAAMTAFYMFRMWFLVFAGEPRGYIPPLDPGSGHGHAAAPEHGQGHDAHHAGNPYDHAHESEPIMSWPLIVLAIPTIFVGWTWWVGLPIGEPVLEQLLAYGEPIEAIDLGAAHLLAMGASLLVAAIGIGLGILYYAPPLPYVFRRRISPQEAVKRFGPIYGFLVQKWKFDELYDAALVRPTLALARASSQFDMWIIDGIVNGSAWLTELLSRLEGVFDNIAVDGLVNWTARIVYATGDWGRGIQTGRLRNYLMFLAVALVGLFAGVFAWIQS
jgi:proton-translocating NADH-quinone oxidoreductase chain L